jgi:YfiH family protein
MKQLSNLTSVDFITHGFYDKIDTSTDTNPILMTQVHSADALFITQKPAEPPKVDALITQTPNLNLTVYTADCAPILLVDTTSKMIAAIHAGWKGAFQGLIENTVLKMIQHSANIDTIHAGIGPHIQQQSFEISPETQALFPLTESSFFKDKNNKIFFDFDSYVIHRLKRAGIQSIQSVGDDTYSNMRYFSFRRGDTVKRQYSSIMITEGK